MVKSANPRSFFHYRPSSCSSLKTANLVFLGNCLETNRVRA